MEKSGELQRTLAIIKPDGVRRKLSGTILELYEKNGLNIAALKMITMTREQAETHYMEHKGKSFYQELIAYIASGPCIAVVLEGEDAIRRVRELNELIRRQYAVNTTENTVHGSDSTTSARREIAVFFDTLRAE